MIPAFCYFMLLMIFIHKTRSYDSIHPISRDKLTTNQYRWIFMSPSFPCYWHVTKLHQDPEVFLVELDAYVFNIYLKVACAPGMCIATYLFEGTCVLEIRYLGSNSSNKFGVNYAQLKRSHLLWSGIPLSIHKGKRSRVNWFGDI